jgi:hypothetical protein
LFERDTFDLFLPEFDKPWVIHLREPCCCSTNLCTWRPNTVYKNRSDCRHQGGDGADIEDDDDSVVDVIEMLPPTPRRSRWCQWWQFASGGCSRSAPLEEEEGFCLLCRLRKL